MSDLKPDFLGVYKKLKSEILNDPDFEFTHDARERVEKMLDYNVPGEKFNRGLSVIDSYSLLLKERDELTSEKISLTSTFGWCIEWLQVYFLVYDDIIDGSDTRRGKECWFRLEEVGMIVVNDGILLRNYIPRILKNYFREKSYYVNLLELFNETASGQMIDLITTHAEKKDLSTYSLSIYRRIVQYKTAYYSFYLPDDYLDCFADLKMLEKKGTDIQDFKCFWLVVKALEHCNEEQKKLLHENYGKADDACVDKVKLLYNDLKLEDVYVEYEKVTYKKLIHSIEAKPRKAVQAVLKSFLTKTYKRQK